MKNFLKIRNLAALSTLIFFSSCAIMKPPHEPVLTVPGSGQVNPDVIVSTVTDIDVSQLARHPYHIVVGPDRNLWFTLFGVHPQVGLHQPGRIGRYNPVTNQLTSFGIDTGVNSRPIGITAGPDGAIWFTDEETHSIYRMNTSGAVTHKYPTPTRNSLPQSITTGADGALWFTERDGNKVGRITTTGVITECAIATPNSAPEVITLGPDGALWFVEENIAKIGRISTCMPSQNNLVEYVIPARATGIVSGSDGALWFAHFNEGKVGRMTVDGDVTNQFSTAISPASAAPIVLHPHYITKGADGALWYTAPNENKIGRMTTSGANKHYLIPTAMSEPFGITQGPTGFPVFFTESSVTKIGNVSAP